MIDATSEFMPTIVQNEWERWHWWRI